MYNVVFFLLFLRFIPSHRHLCHAHATLSVSPSAARVRTRYTLQSFSSYSLRCLIPCCVLTFRVVTYRLPICSSSPLPSKLPPPKDCEKQYHGMVVRNATVTDRRRHRLRHRRHYHQRGDDNGQQRDPGTLFFIFHLSALVFPYVLFKSFWRTFPPHAGVRVFGRNTWYLATLVYSAATAAVVAGPNGHFKR